MTRIEALRKNGSTFDVTNPDPAIEALRRVLQIGGGYAACVTPHNAEKLFNYGMFYYDMSVIEELSKKRVPARKDLKNVDKVIDGYALVDGVWSPRFFGLRGDCIVDLFEKAEMYFG